MRKEEESDFLIKMALSKTACDVGSGWGGEKGLYKSNQKYSTFY